MVAGRHAIRVRYVDYGGGAKLWVRWTPPGESEGPLPEERFAHASTKEASAPPEDTEPEGDAQ